MPRAADHPDEQRRFGDVQVLHVLAEIELRRQAHAVDRAVAVLAEVNLVEVRLEDLVLLVVDLEQHRHHQFGGLAANGALGRKEEVLHQLLGDGAAALHPVGEQAAHGARQPTHVEAGVPVEAAVLDRNQCRDQVLRHLGQPHQHPVLVSGRVDAADRQGLDARKRHVHSGRITQHGNLAAVEGDAHAARRLGAVPEDERAQRDLQPVLLAQIPAGLIRAREVPVTEQLPARPPRPPAAMRRPTCSSSGRAKMRAGSAKRRPSNSSRTRKSR